MMFCQVGNFCKILYIHIAVYRIEEPVGYALAKCLREMCVILSSRVPTRPGKPGKPGKMRVHLENLEISWNFEKLIKYHGKMS